MGGGAILVRNNGHYGMKPVTFGCGVPNIMPAHVGTARTHGVNARGRANSGSVISISGCTKRAAVNIDFNAVAGNGSLALGDGIKSPAGYVVSRAGDGWNRRRHGVWRVNI